MYKVLPVDDEPIFTEFMRNVIDWGTLGCELCGCASDGEQPLEMTRVLQPDILLLDINIPLINGLEVCRRLKKENIPCAVAIVSAHNNFQFAQTAIKYGVSDYLLKPFNRTELLRTLQGCFAKVRLQRGDLLRRCLAGQAEMRVPASIVLLRRKAPADVLEELAQQAETRIHCAGGDCSYFLEPEQVVFACSFPKGSAQRPAPFFEPVSPDVCVAVGDCCGDWRQSLQHAQQALENRALVQGSIIFYEELRPHSGGAVFAQSDLMRLVGCLNNNDEKGVTELVYRLFGLEEGHSISFQYFLSVLSSLTLHMAQYYGKNRENTEKLLAQQSSVMRDIADAVGVTEIAAAIENYVYELYSDCITIGPITRRGELVDKINRSIAAHYRQKGFTVEKMAAELMYENSYMRRVYKTETGITIF